MANPYDTKKDNTVKLTLLASLFGFAILFMLFLLLMRVTAASEKDFMMCIPVHNTPSIACEEMTKKKFLNSVKQMQQPVKRKPVYKMRAPLQSA